MEVHRTSQLVDEDGEFLLVPCVVMGDAGSGPPCPVLVLCSQSAYDNGDHYEAASDGATSYSWVSSKSENVVVYDAEDGPDWMFKQFAQAEFVCVDCDGNKISVSGWGEDALPAPATTTTRPTREELLGICYRLKEWEGNMGGFENPIWQELQDLLERERVENPLWIGVDFGTPGTDRTVVMYRCQACGHIDDEDEFIPSDGNPAPHVCPGCGLTDVFPKDPEEEET